MSDDMPPLETSADWYTGTGRRVDSSADWPRQPSKAGRWVHRTDGSHCPTQLNDRRRPDSDNWWWCTEHQSHLQWVDSGLTSVIEAELRRHYAMFGPGFLKCGGDGWEGVAGTYDTHVASALSEVVQTWLEGR